MLTRLQLTLAAVIWSSVALATPSPMTLEDLARIKQVIGAEMSPDGDKIAYLMSKPRDLNSEADGDNWRELFVVDKKGRQRAFVTGPNKIGTFRWSADGDNLWFLAKRPNDKFVSLYMIADAGGEARKVVNHANNIQGFHLANNGQKLLFWAPEKHSVEKLELHEEGFNALVFEEDVATNQLWEVDFDNGDNPIQMVFSSGHILNAQYLPDEKSILIQYTSDALTDNLIMQKKLAVIDLKGRIQTAISHVGKMGKVSLSPDGKQVAVIGTNDIKDPAEGRLMVASTVDGTIRHLVPGGDFHVKDIAWLSRSTLGFIAHRGVESFFASKRVASDSTKFKTLLKNAGIITRLSTSNSGRESALIIHTPAHPREVFWFNKSGLQRISLSNAWLENISLGRQQVLEFKGQDGLSLEGILVHPTTPPEGPAPLLIFVHGGPEAHFSNGWVTRYSHPAQVAAGKGYLSFLPNYRGSTGRGVDFTQLGQNDYAGAEFDDLLAAKHHLVKMGLADANRTGITGASYGGYASAWAATRHSEHFAASVATMGIGNQVSKFGTTDIPTEMYTQHAQQWPWEDWMWLLKRSPIYYSDQANTPLLLMHGKLDERVHYSQSLELYRYLKQRTETPIRLVLYPNEGHGFVRQAAKLDYSKRLMRWMDHFLVQSESTLPPLHIDHRLSRSPTANGEPGH